MAIYVLERGARGFRKVRGPLPEASSRPGDPVRMLLERA
jgi:hypothetical protein